MRRARPPVGLQRTVLQDPQSTTVRAFFTTSPLSVFSCLLSSLLSVVFGAGGGDERAAKTHVGEDGGHVHACGALDVHEEAVGRGNKTLELVLAGLGGLRGVKQIFFELFGGRRGRGRAMRSVRARGGRGRGARGTGKGGMRHSQPLRLDGGCVVEKREKDDARRAQTGPTERSDAIGRITERADWTKKKEKKKK